MFFMDVKEFSPLLNDLLGFYHALVDSILQQCQVQRPWLVDAITAIHRYLHSVVTEPSVLQLSKDLIPATKDTRIEQKIMEIGQKLREAWNDNESLDLWLISVFNVLLTLPKVLGFTRTLIVVDNLEYSDVGILPLAQFSRSRKMEVFSEYLKQAMALNDFIFSCEDERHLYQVMNPLDDNDVDLFAISELISTIGICKSNDEVDALITKIENDPVPLILKVGQCGGVPAYLALWEEAVKLVSEVEESQEGSEKRFVAECDAITAVEKLANVLFTEEDCDELIRIESVRRLAYLEQKEYNKSPIHFDMDHR
jgi:uncharacterized DUF497 family protein